MTRFPRISLYGRLQRSGRAPRLFFLALLVLSYGLHEVVKRERVAAGTDAPTSPLAPGREVTSASVAPGTIPPLAPLSSTVSLPLVFSELPRYLPLISFALPHNIPSDPHPADGARGQSPNAYLGWQLAAADGSRLRYEVYLDPYEDEVAPHTLIYTGEPPNLAFDPTTFLPDVRYAWQVVAIAEAGKRSYGPIWSFQTEGFQVTPDVEAMVSIPAGEFRMGCDGNMDRVRGCIRKDSPLHTVYLDAYEIDKYEVTNGQYDTCVRAGKCKRPRRFNSHIRNRYYNRLEFDDFPVLYVSWWDAQDYCGWKGKRLPTEAEWEKAARGPIDTRTWPWGNEFPDCSRLNYTDNRQESWTVCVGDTTRVGSYPSGASPYGVMDMAGNVFEWVADIWDDNYGINYYRISPYYNPTGPNLSKNPGDNPYFTIRGGSYRPNWFYTRVANRHHGHHGDQVGTDKPNYRNDQVGFRCARSAP